MPNFNKALLPGKESMEEVKVAQADPIREAAITDTHIPEISVGYHGLVIEHVLIDEGAGINIITRDTCEIMGRMDWLPVPFLVRMVDQRRVHPLGILKGIVLDIGGISFAMSFVIIGMEEANEEYNLLLGTLVAASQGVA